MTGNRGEAPIEVVEIEKVVEDWGIASEWEYEQLVILSRATTVHRPSAAQSLAGYWSSSVGKQRSLSASRGSGFLGAALTVLIGAFFGRHELSLSATLLGLAGVYSGFFRVFLYPQVDILLESIWCVYSDSLLWHQDSL